MKVKNVCILLIILVFFVGCGRDFDKSQIDTPIEYLAFTNQNVTDFEYEKLISFLYEAEIMMQKPLKDAQINEAGLKVFSGQIKNKNDLFWYYQTYLSNELAETMARKVSDLSKSSDEFLAVSSEIIDWISIHDANPASIKIIQHTNVQSVVEMDCKKEPNTRIQYTIMKNSLGQNPKIVQKTVLYN